MSSLPDFNLQELASIVEAYLPSSSSSHGNSGGDSPFQTRADWYAVYINRVRSLGASNFCEVESESQLIDIKHEVRALLKKIKGLGRHAAFLQLNALLAARADKESPNNRPELAAFIGLEELAHQLDLTLVALDWRELNVRPKRWKLAKKRNWKVPSIALACRHVDAQEHIATDSAKWAEFLREHPKANDGSHVTKFYEAAAPRTADRNTPGKFGRFLESVLSFYDERGRNGELVSAAVALRALRDIRAKQR